ncbi:surfeit locus protein 6 isoform X2 [Peromyscus eremicus]|uniref:surfeit locus protein 6 isoform X2 n=1 Tax=Peromyscus eremicus TaxID=42410 RepID=UPI0027DBA99C|nr:surfeit locus protein 6 isoform X2 [Peromyscus eremicus]
MASLQAKDTYLQDLAKKICAQPGPERRRSEWAGRTKRLEAAGPPKKKRKKTQKKSQEQGQKATEHKTKPVGKTAPTSSRAKKPTEGREEWWWGSSSSSLVSFPADSQVTAPDSVFALDFLRQRLHEKIQLARGQGTTKELSAATLEKRQRRKQERERKKRKRKELRAKEKAAKAGKKEEPAEAPPEGACKEPQESGLIFNKVEVTEDEPASKAQRKKEKRQKVKGNLTPLTGRNYRQLLERLQARQDRLEELRDQDAGKAQELEAKMKWTNLLYKAEGVKIRDNEHLLQEALKRKEKRKAQRQRRWEKRSEHVVEKMQQRQDKRRQNLRKKKAARAERRLQKARKKGRVLPQDLERAGLS